MEVPLHLARRESPLARADAFLLFAATAEPLAGVYSLVAKGSPTRVYGVKGGFLVVPDEATTTRPPGAIRLRRQGGDFYLPVDADLRPALLPDEIVGLTAARGLIALPGGRILAFEARLPMPLSHWVQTSRIDRNEWKPLPARPLRPEQLVAIERPSPLVSEMDLLSEGAPDDASPLAGPNHATNGPIPEEARPASGRHLTRLSAAAGLTAANALLGLARMLRAPGLARFAANLARRAVAAVPRLTERMLGEQEAALRNVLRQLQSGDIEKGLRRAPIAVGDPNRPARIANYTQLGTRDPRYSLRDLIGSNSGTQWAWLGGGDVWAELAKEYRRLAQEAISRGDFRRAAYLYGVLLRDLSSAANALMAGGLFRDAGILYRDRLNNLKAAADAFERGGDHDEALRLYEKALLFEEAADLLVKLGEAERAIDYYLRAAQQHADRKHWIAAGEMLKKKAGRSDLANRYYRSGWESDSAESATCGEHLLDSHFVAADRAATAALLDQAEARLAERPRDLGRFFNYALEVGSDFLGVEAWSDLGDRTRLLFAGMVRKTAGNKVESLRRVSDLFGQSPLWPGPLVRDVTYAIEKANRLPAKKEELANPALPRLLDGTVTAVVFARGTYDIVVASTTEVVCWRPGAGRIVPVCNVLVGKVLALSTDSQAQVVYVLLEDNGKFHLNSYSANRDGAFKRQGHLLLPFEGADAANVYLQPSAVFQDGDYSTMLNGPAGRMFVQSASLLNRSRSRYPLDGKQTLLLAEGGDGWNWNWSSGGIVFYSSIGDYDDSIELPVNWTPRVPIGSSLAQPPLDWIVLQKGILEVVGIDETGAAYWSKFNAIDLGGSETAARAHTTAYTAICMMAPSNVIVATASNEIQRHRIAAGHFVQTGTISANFPTRIVSLSWLANLEELAAILSDGTVARIPGLAFR